MSCSYYENKSYWGLDVYCHKKGDRVNQDMYDKYCKGYNYNECPIYKGSSSSSGGCYLTSACVYAKGLPDDCYELQTLRNYRDTWMKTQAEGASLIREYYCVAPKIVSAINELPERKEIYNSIYEKMILPCIRLIEAKQFEDTLALYKECTLKLKERYC